jgi:hypothetical protein
MRWSCRIGLAVAPCGLSGAGIRIRTGLRGQEWLGELLEELEQDPVGGVPMGELDELGASGQRVFVAAFGRWC